MYFANASWEPAPLPTMSTSHEPVMLHEVLAVLRPENGRAYLDCTFGGGGHTRAILQAGPDVRVDAIDRDPAAVERAASLKAEFGERFRLFSRNYAEIDKLGTGGYAGILFDLGVSSFQLDEPERGFSFRAGGPADMRMNPLEGWSAADFLEQAPESELIRAVRDYGEELRWRRVVTAILSARRTGALRDTASLAALVAEAVGERPGRPGRIHPATRTFQGIRIAVNDELAGIETALPKAFDALAPGGILAVISFHSLEDRIVKRFFRRMAGRPEHAGDSTAAQDRVRRADLLGTRPIVPGEEEINRNPRSRSAKLRALRKEDAPQ